MILYRPLPTPHDKTELSKAHLVQLLEYKLNNRFQTKIPVLTLGEDRQHLLRLLLRHRQEPRPKSRRRNHNFLQQTTPAPQKAFLDGQLIISRNKFPRIHLCSIFARTHTGRAFPRKRGHMSSFTISLASSKGFLLAASLIPAKYCIGLR